MDRTVGPLLKIMKKAILLYHSTKTKFIWKNFRTSESKDVLSMPTLDELVKWSKENKIKMLFDIKDADHCVSIFFAFGQKFKKIFDNEEFIFFSFCRS